MNLHINKMWFSITFQEKQDLSNFSELLDKFLEEANLITDFYNLQIEDDDIEETIDIIIEELEDSDLDNKTIVKFKDALDRLWQAHSDLSYSSIYS